MEHFYQNIKGHCTFFNFYKWIITTQLPKDKESRCVELGTHAGQSAAFFAVEAINNNVPTKLDLVEFYSHDLNKRMQMAKAIENLFKNCRSVIDKVIPAFTNDAAKMYEDNSIDFLMIDADHSYQGVKEDIVNWKPKMKSGGIMSGHDFVPYDWGVGVTKAVTEEFEQWNVHRGEVWLGNDEASKKDIIKTYGLTGVYLPVWWVRIP